jgi:ribosomal protein S18 acetylase RimI-like enzyme
MTASAPAKVTVRAIRKEDAAAITRIDALHTGTAKRKWWDGVIARHLRKSASVGLRVGLVAEGGRGKVVGFLFGQVRAFEFGSEPCGWIFAVGVHPDAARRGVAGLLLAEANARFLAARIPVVRTMVRNDDVPVLTFFRSQGFSAGPFVELELALAEERP